MANNPETRIIEDHLDFAQTFTLDGNGTGQKVNRPVRDFTLHVKGTGAGATAWTVTLKGSLDGVNWTTLISHANGDGDNTFKFTSGKPVLYVRLDMADIDLGSATAIVARAIAMP